MSSLIYAGMGKWMDLKDEIKIGDYVICIAEKSVPRFIGHKWYVVKIRKGLYYCRNLDLYSDNTEEDCYVFKFNEIVPVTPLMEELI